MDGSFTAGIEEELSRLEKPIRVPDTEDGYGRFAMTGNLENSFMEGAHLSVSASPPFRKNNDVPAAGQMPGQGVQAVQEKG